MTNEEIKKYKKDLASINNEVNIGETEPLKERLERLYSEKSGDILHISSWFSLI